MIEIIKSHDSSRALSKLAQIKERSVALDKDLIAETTAIVEDVRRRKDHALIELTARFDDFQLDEQNIRVDEMELREQAQRTDAEVRRAISEAIKRIRRFHEHERQHSWQFETGSGSTLGQRFSPIESAGVYVPGGTAAYPSSVLMNIIPAQIAGVARIVVATPPRTLQQTPAICAALVELGVTEVYRIGGAQAIAALAYGTQTVPRVDKITGPGNKYVAAAKKIVFGAVGIDSIAGPSEVVIIADETADASYVAADLLAQAEHDPDASAVLVTTDERLAAAVTEQVERQIKTLPRCQIIKESLTDYGAIFIVNNIAEACALVNELAPEHLEIMARDDEGVAAQIKHAGAIFFGAQTPEAVGDYFAGPNHVLPTGGTARFSSALGVWDFMRRTSLIRYSSKEMRDTAQMIATFAEAEGLSAHARSALIRLDND